VTEGTITDSEAIGLRPVSRSGSFTRLEPIQNEHLDFLYRLSIGEETGFRWRFVGSMPSPEAFRSTLWSGVLCQFIVIENGGGQPIGTVVAYNADLHAGFAYVGVCMSPTARRTGIGIDALRTFLGCVFGTWNLRKIYIEVPEYNLSQFESGYAESLFVEEGRLREHVYYGHEWWDVVILAVYRDAARTFTQSRTRRRRSTTRG
jgi:RimJ/RimL family protein N-acetyltransferase